MAHPGAAAHPLRRITWLCRPGGDVGIVLRRIGAAALVLIALGCGRGGDATGPGPLPEAERPGLLSPSGLFEVHDAGWSPTPVHGERAEAYWRELVGCAGLSAGLNRAGLFLHAYEERPGGSGFVFNGSFASGQYVSATYEIHVVGELAPVWKGTWKHEMLHLLLHLATGNGDGAHVSPLFNACAPLYDDAAAKLSTAGGTKHSSPLRFSTTPLDLVSEVEMVGAVRPHEAPGDVEGQPRLAEQDEPAVAIEDPVDPDLVGASHRAIRPAAAGPISYDRSAGSRKGS